MSAPMTNKTFGFDIDKERIKELESGYDKTDEVIDNSE